MTIDQFGARATTRPTDSPAANLGRIQADTHRIRDGWRRFRELGLSPETPIGVVAIDIDSSARVRAHGIEAKIELVAVVRNAIKSELNPSFTVIDSGTRDETYLVLTGAAASRAYDVAEEARRAVEQHRFELTSVGSVDVTVSCGVGEGVCGRLDEVLSAADAGQMDAKLTRNRTRRGIAVMKDLNVHVPTALLARLGEASSNPLPREPTQDVVMKYTGIWHWLIDFGLETGQLDSDTWADAVGPEATADSGFVRLVASAADEWSVMAHVPPTEGSALAAIHTARYGAERSPLHTSLASHVLETWERKVMAPRTLSVDDLVTEVLSIMDDSRVLAVGDGPAE